MLIGKDLYIFGDEYMSSTPSDSHTKRETSGDQQESQDIMKNNSSESGDSCKSHVSVTMELDSPCNDSLHGESSTPITPHPHHPTHHHELLMPNSCLTPSGPRPLDVVFKNISVSIKTKSKSSIISTFCASIKTKLSKKETSLSSSTSCGNFPSDPVCCEKTILDDVSGYARPGQILGIMGPSGSGKTTLLTALSGRLKPDRGTIHLNGQILNKQLRRKICYVLQQDIFFADLTLRQTLVYTALLRLPDSMSYDQKMKHVDYILDVLDLRQSQHTIVGDMLKRGLSGGEKKRASIACELLTNPAVLLIDEPTSGLDSSTAHSLMQLLKDYAVRERKTVITTIHQPSSQIFHMFDKLLLMSGGQVAYFGDVNSVVPFFSSVGFQMSAHYNPADFVMEKIKGDPRDAEKIIKAAKDIQAFPELIHSSSTRHTCSSRHTQNGSSSHPQIVVNSSFHSPDEDLPLKSSEEDTEPSEKHVLWSHNDDNDDSHQKSDVRVVVDPRDRNHKVYSRVVNDCDSGRASWTEGVMDGRSTKTYSSSSASSSCASTCSGEMYFDFTHGESESCRKEEKWAASFWTQLKVLTARNFYEARGRMLSKLNWIQTIGLAFVTGSIWYQIKRTEDTLVDVKGWMFFSMTYWMLFALFNAMVSFPPEREVINKERASGAYRLSSYYVAKMIGELPLTLAMPTTFHFISYPLLGHSNLHTFLILWVFQVLSSVVAQSVGLFIGAATLDLEVSITISALYSMSSILFGGFYSTTMPPFLAWIRYFSMVYYAFQNMLMIEFSVGSPVLCSEINSKFSSCRNLTNSTSSAGAGGGYPDRIIPYEELQLHLDTLESKPLPIWLNTLILIAFLIFFRTMGYLVLRYIRKPK